MQQIKLLWVGDSVTPTGFSRVTHNVLDNLHATGEYEIQVVGVNYFGDPHPYPYAIWPARSNREVMGFVRLPNIVEAFKPDIVFLFNDLWVINEYAAKSLTGYKGKRACYFPIDATGYKKTWLDSISNFDMVSVYTEFASKVMRDSGYNGKLSIIPHGVDRNVYYPIPTELARTQLNGLNPNDFIVFNGNRNQPRKRIDITIKGFAKFAAQHEDARLYLHMGVLDSGWDIIALCEREFSKYGLDIGSRLILTNPNLSPANAVSEQQLNLIYNSCNVGVNTSLGEGWGLINVEHASCMVPQIVPDYAASKELFQDRGLLLPIRQYISSLNINTEGGLVHEDNVAQALELYYTQPDLAAKHAMDMYDYLAQPQFQWSNVAACFDKEIKSIL